MSTYNGDVADGLVQLCLAERLSRRAHHLSSGTGAAIVDLADAVRRIPAACRHRDRPG